MRHRIVIGCALSAGFLACSAGAAPAQDAQRQDAQRLAALSGRVAALAEEARHVEDVNAIRRLQHAYGYYLEKGYWNEAADLFAADAVLEVGGDGIWRGQDRIRQAIVARGDGADPAEFGPGFRFGQLYHPFQLQPMVTVSADGLTAQARWREFLLKGEYQASAHWGDAVMENDYVKEDGVWKIAALRLYPNFVAPYHGGWASLEPVAGDWSSEAAARVPPDAPPDVSYAPFPDQFTPPFHYAADGGPAVRAAPPFAAPPPRADDAVGELEAIADDYERRLAIARSERAIENLQTALGYYIDRGMWEEAAGLFAEDGTYEFGQSGLYRGRARVRAALGLMGPEGLRPGQLNAYPMLQPIVTVAADNSTARARWRSNVMLSEDGAGRWGAGVFENEYVNQDGVWRISRFHYYVSMWADYDLGWVQGALPMDGPSEAAPPDAPPTEIYESLPAMYLPAYHYRHPVTGEVHWMQAEGADR